VCFAFEAAVKILKEKVMGKIETETNGVSFMVYAIKL